MYITNVREYRCVCSPLNVKVPPSPSYALHAQNTHIAGRVDSGCFTSNSHILRYPSLLPAPITDHRCFLLHPNYLSAVETFVEMKTKGKRGRVVRRLMVESEGRVKVNRKTKVEKSESRKRAGNQYEFECIPIDTNTWQCWGNMTLQEGVLELMWCLRVAYFHFRPRTSLRPLKHFIDSSVLFCHALLDVAHTVARSVYFAIFRRRVFCFCFLYDRDDASE